MEAVRDWNEAAALRARPRAGRVFVRVQAVVLFAACLLGGYVLIEQRSETEARARNATMGLTSAVAAHIGDLVNLYDYDLKAIATAIDAAGGDIVPVATRQTIVSSVGKRAKALRLLAVLNAKGDLVFESISSTVRQANYSDRDYFHAQEKANVGLFISRPFIGRLDGELEIALSRRLTHKDGSFAGVAFGIIKLSLLKDLFDLAPSGAEGSVSLLRTDGIVLMRKPYRDGYIGRDLGSSPLFALAKASPAGFVEGSASVDGVDRIYAFNHVGDLPLILSVGTSRADVFAGIDRNLILLAGVIALLVANVALLAIALRGPSMTRRSQSR
jgi:hypothetical protein